MVEAQEGGSCPAALDLSSHPEDLFAESGELDWICGTEPGALEERMAEDQTKKEAAREKEREKKDKKEKKKKAAKDKKDKKNKKDKKEKKEKKEKKATKDKKEPVVVPARVITLSALREELERYCTIHEITSGHLNPWATDPHLQRPAIIAAIAERLGCSYVALSQWKTHILCWLEFRAAQGRCVRKPETEAEKLPPQKKAATAKAMVNKKAEAEAKKKPRDQRLAETGLLLTKHCNKLGNLSSPNTTMLKIKHGNIALPFILLIVPTPFVNFRTLPSRIYVTLFPKNFKITLLQA